jgi:PAS domain S-box-containing protein
MLTVLYVEDDLRDVELTRRRLLKAAPHVTLDAVTSVRDALARLAQPAASGYDLVLADVRLPDGDGLSLLAHIRDRALPLAVVIVTGSGDEDTAVAALKAGADDYLVKRDDYLERLPLVLDSALGRRRVEAARHARPVRVLYAEHDAADIELTRRHIARYAPHIRLDIVSTGAEALQRLFQPPGASNSDNAAYGLFLLDYHLPGANALDILKELRQGRNLDIPIVLITGHGSEEVALQALKLGAADYLVKNPGYLFRLPAALENVFYRAELAREEAALRESKQRLDDILASLDDMLWSETPGSPHQVYVSPGAERVFGLPAAAFYDNPRLWRDLVHPDDRTHVEEYLKVRRESGGGEAEYRIVRPDGAVRWVRDRSRVIRDPDGAIARIDGITVDITERKRVEAELLARARQQAAVADIGQRALGGAELQALIDEAVALVARTLDVEYCKVLELLPDGQALVLRGGVGWKAGSIGRVLVNAGAGSQAGYTLLSNEPVIVEDLRAETRFSGPLLLHEHGVVSGLSVVIPDQNHPYGILSAHTTQRRAFSEDDVHFLQAIANILAAAIERRRRERELEAIATTATALRAAPTRADMLRVIAHQTRRLLKAEGVSLVMRDLISGERVNVLADGAWAGWNGIRTPPGVGITGHVITTGRPYLSNDIFSDPLLIRPDLMGNLRAVVCAPLIEQGQTIGVLWAGRATDMADDDLRLLALIGDIATNALSRAQLVETLEQRVVERTRELAEANARLTELDRLKTKFVSDVSHELRTPVTNLKLYVELLARGKPEKREQYMQTIMEQANRLAQLVEDILNLSRLELRGASIELGPVELNALVEQVVVAQQPRAEAAGLALSFEPVANLAAVRGERNQLAQVITNLVANAINYTPAGRVRVSTCWDEARRQACLQVEDTGVGIGPADMPHLFERFYRGQQTGQSDIPGNGLGLAITKEIIDLHGGAIEVDSRLGEGSTFRVWLPPA